MSHLHFNDLRSLDTRSLAAEVNGMDIPIAAATRVRPIRDSAASLLTRLDGAQEQLRAMRARLEAGDYRECFEEKPAPAEPRCSLPAIARMGR